MNLNAVTLQNQSFAAKPDELYLNKSNENFKIPNNELKYDEFTSSSKNNSQKKVSFKEGLELVGKGFVNKLKNMAASIIQHPVKTLAAVGTTALLISAAPIIGITSATAGAFLALGFAAYAVGKTTVDIVETVKDSKEGKYDEVRQDLEQIGGDGVDLALSLPFAPKAIKQVSRFASYGRGTVGLNTELLSNLKNCRSYSDVSLEFTKADTLINYEMIGNEMGLAVKPKLVFKDLITNPGQGIMAGAYEPATGELQINQNILTGKGKLYAKMGGVDNIETILRHELEHFRQFSDTARTENIGVEGLRNTLTEYFNSLKNKASMNELEEAGFSKNTIENMTSGDKSAFNMDLYQKVVDKQGVIKSGTQEAEMSAKYLKGLLEKADPSPESLAEFEEVVNNCTSFSDIAKILKTRMELYKSNILEKEAYAAQDKFVSNVIKGRPTIVNDAIMADAIVEEYFPDDNEQI